MPNSDGAIGPRTVMMTPCGSKAKVAKTQLSQTIFTHQPEVERSLGLRKNSPTLRSLRTRFQSLAQFGTNSGFVLLYSNELLSGFTTQLFAV
jgi:hypothetical protein